MPSAIVYDRDAALRQGIGEAGTALGQALAHRTQQQQQQAHFKDILRLAQDGPLTQDKILTIAAMPGGSQFLQSAGQFLLPQIKAQAASDVGTSIDQQYTPSPISPSGVVAQDQGALQQALGVEGGTPPAPPSPIEQAKIAQTPQEEEIKQSTIVETPSGSYEESEFIDTPYGKYHPKQLQKYSSSGIPGLQEKAKLVDRYLLEQEKLKGTEGKDQRKEWRKEIQKFSEPFQDISKLNTSVKKLEKAKELILSGKTSRDGMWVRRAVQSVLEDKGSLSKSELIKTSEDQVLYSLIYETLRTKDLGGSNPSTREVLLSLAAKPSPFKGERANIDIINDLLRQANENLEKGKATSEIRDRSGPISFPRFQRELGEMVGKFTDKFDQKIKEEDRLVDAKISVRGRKPLSGFVWMADPDGIPKKVPTRDIKRLEQLGGVLLNGK